MILDLQRFVTVERPFWTELETQLRRVEGNQRIRLSLEQTRRFHYLYDRTSAGLGRIMTFSAEPEIRRYLEDLVARAYAESHEARRQGDRWPVLEWFFGALPRAFRRHVWAFWLAAGITLVGALFGGAAVALDPDAKEAVLPEMFANHNMDPAERVRQEESNTRAQGTGSLTRFSAHLMVNNIGVSIKALALGMTWGLGTILILFYNGVILGVVSVDYVLAGQLKFLLAWLLPHGVIEIPAVLMGGQGGLVLARALIGWGERTPITQRLRDVRRDLVTLIAGVALLLVWAGLVEAFLSQFHQPVLPYGVKIAFGIFEFAMLLLFLGWCGRTGLDPRPKSDGRNPNVIRNPRSDS